MVNHLYFLNKGSCYISTVSIQKKKNVEHERLHFAHKGTLDNPDSSFCFNLKNRHNSVDCVTSVPNYEQMVEPKFFVLFALCLWFLTYLIIIFNA